MLFENVFHIRIFHRSCCIQYNIRDNELDLNRGRLFEPVIHVANES
jgi:hypothetical protein